MDIDIDPVEKAGLITRTVDTVERDGKPAKRLTAARSYPTSIEDLWDTVTNVERIPRWFLPIEGDLHVGGRFQLEGNAAGEVLACEPPRRFEITWEYGGEVSWVTVEFSGDPGGDETDLVLQHVAHVPDEMWDQFGPGAVGIGWDLGLMGLDLHITAGEAVSPADVQGWDATPEAADFTSRSSTAWAEASIASGTGRADALAAAERVTAFYTATE